MAKKKEKPKAHPSQIWKLFGSGKKGKSCPKCGAGVFMANHKDRNYCGKCHYTEFNKKE